MTKVVRGIRVVLGFVIILVGYVIDFNFILALEAGSLQGIVERIGRAVLALLLFLPFVLIGIKPLYDVEMEKWSEKFERRKEGEDV